MQLIVYPEQKDLNIILNYILIIRKIFLKI